MLQVLSLHCQREGEMCAHRCVCPLVTAWHVHWWWGVTAGEQDGRQHACTHLSAADSFLLQSLYFFEQKSSPSHLDSQGRMWHLSELQLWFQTAAMKLITTTQSTHSQPLWTHALFCCVWLTVGDLPQQRYTETKVPLCCLALTTWFHRR